MRMLRGLLIVLSVSVLLLAPTVKGGSKPIAQERAVSGAGSAHDNSHPDACSNAKRYAFNDAKGQCPYNTHLASSKTSECDCEENKGFGVRWHCTATVEGVCKPDK